MTTTSNWANYLGRLPNQPSYVTMYRLFCEAVQQASNPLASIEVLDRGRNAVASRRDMLVGRQRRRYCPKRAEEAESLGDIYREILARMIAKGWR